MTTREEETVRIPVPPPSSPAPPFGNGEPDPGQTVRMDAGKRWWQKLTTWMIAASVIGAALYVAQRQLSEPKPAAKLVATDQAKTASDGAVIQTPVETPLTLAAVLDKAVTAEKKADALSDWLNEPNEGFVKKVNDTHELQVAQAKEIETLKKEVEKLKAEIILLKKPRGETAEGAESEGESESESDPFIEGE